MKTMKLIPTLTAAAALMMASCNCSDTLLPKEVEDRVEDVRERIKTTISDEDLLGTVEWLENRRLDRALRKFILDETYDKDENPDAGKGGKQKKRIESLIEKYEEELGPPAFANTKPREVDILERAKALIRTGGLDKPFFGRMFEDPELVREWMEFCYRQSGTIHAGRGKGRIEVDDYKFVAITMTLFDIASRQLQGFSSEDFQRLTETIQWYEGVKSQVLTNVVRIKEAKELEKKGHDIKAAGIYIDVGVGSGEALDYAIDILAVAQTMESQLAEIRARHGDSTTDRVDDGKGEMDETGASWGPITLDPDDDDTKGEIQETRLDPDVPVIPDPEDDNEGIPDDDDKIIYNPWEGSDPPGAETDDGPP